MLSLKKAIELQLRLLCFMDTSRHNEFKPLDEIVFKAKYAETIEYDSNIDIGDLAKKLITELEIKKILRQGWCNKLHKLCIDMYEKPITPNCNIIKFLPDEFQNEIFFYSQEHPAAKIMKNNICSMYCMRFVEPLKCIVAIRKYNKYIIENDDYGLHISEKEYTDELGAWG